jgi:hypothetical protein
MNSPDETRTFEKGKLEFTTFKNGTAIGRITLEPGWSWDKCVKPIVKTNSCEAPHTQYMISGRIRNLTKITESWLDSFSKFWSVPFGDKVKVE